MVVPETVKVRHTYRARPSKTAQQKLVAQFGGCRFVWNHLVAESKRRYRENPDSTFGFKDQSRELTRLRQEVVDPDGRHWLGALSSVPQQQMVRAFARSRTKALLDRKNLIPVAKRAGLPTFKSRHRAPVSLTYTLRGFRLIEETDDQGRARTRLKLAGGIVIPVVWSRTPPVEATTVTIYQDNLNQWWVSFVVEEALSPQRRGGLNVGVDWGVATTATTATIEDGLIDTSDRFDLPNARRSKQAQQEVARHQRQMARRRRPKGQDRTKGYATAKRQTARAIKKAANQRRDDANQWASRLTKCASHVAVEDFKPAFMSKTTLAKSASDSAVGAAKAALLWQAHKRGCQTTLVNPKYTTMDCSRCGARAKPLTLNTRTYQCIHCHSVLDRDKNAAINMLNRAGLNPACTEGIRPEPAAVRELAA